jgi:glutamate racemase
VVEEGLSETYESELLVRHYLKGRPELDVLILGCTHYPVLRETIQRVVGPAVALVDSAEVTAERVGAAFPAIPRCFQEGRTVYYVTGDPAAFVHTARAIAEIREAVSLPVPLKRAA